MRLFVLTAALAAVSSWVGAAELGSLSLVSRLGEPFDARLDLRDVKPGETVEVSLGDPSLYEKVGRKLTPEVTTFRIASRKDARGRFRIQSTEVLNNTEPFPLILVMKADSKYKAKVYNIKLAPPRSISRNTPSKAPVVIEHRENTQSLSSAKDEKKSVKSHGEPALRQPKAASVSKAKTEAVAKKPVPVKKSTVPPRKPVQKTTLPEQTHAPIAVSQGMTLWSIAGQVRTLYPQASMDRIQVALVRANPRAFKNGRIASLKLGSRLRIPSAELINSITEQEAWAIVRIKPRMNALKTPSAKRMAAAKKKMPASRLATKPVHTPKEGLAVTNAVKASESNVRPPEVTAPAQEATVRHETTAVPSTTTPMPSPENHNAAASSASESSGNQTPEVFQKSESQEPSAAQTQMPNRTELSASEKVTEKTEKSEFPWGGVFGALAVLAALVVGFVYWRRRRNALEGADSEKLTESPVHFCQNRSETSPEQLSEIDNTVSRRIASDVRAARGFELKSPNSPELGAQHLTEDRRSAQEIGAQDVHPRENLPETTDADRRTSHSVEAGMPVVGIGSSEIETKNEPEPVLGRIEPTLGIESGDKNPESNASGKEALSQTPDLNTVSEQSLDQKLTQARALLQASLSNRAIELLEEIALKGNEKQRAAALKLLTEKQP